MGDDLPRYVPPPNDHGEFVVQIIGKPDPDYGSKVKQARLELGRARAHEHMRLRPYPVRLPPAK